MPQLDIVPYASIYLWVIFLFFLFYFLFLKIILPIISQWLKTYTKLQIYIITLLIIFENSFFAKEFLIQEVLIKSANFMLSVSLLTKNLPALLPSFLAYVNISTYEKSCVYLIKKCFKSTF